MSRGSGISGTVDPFPYCFLRLIGISSVFFVRGCARIRNQYMSLRFPRAGALLAASISFHVLGQAAADDTILVTSTRLGDTAQSAPQSVTIITAKDISESTATTLPDVLRQAVGVSRTSLYGNQGALDSIDLRGFGVTGTQNTLILIDGRRLNDIDLSFVDFSTIPLDRIERIEISHGGGNVLYGDGAVGGSINIITKRTGRQGTSGQARLAAGSYDTQQISASLDHASGPFSLSLSGAGTDSDGYRKNNALQQRNAQSDLRFSGDEGELYLKLGADSQHLRLPGPRTVDPQHVDDQGNPDPIDELHNDRRGTNEPNNFANQNGYFVTTGLRRDLSDSTEAIADIGYRNKNQHAYYEDFLMYLDSTLGTWSFTPRLTTDYQLFGQGGQLVTGLDYYHSDYDSDRSSKPSTIGKPIHALDIRQTSTAAYMQTTHDLDAQTALTVGGRLEWVRINMHDRFDPAADGVDPIYTPKEAAPLSRSDRQHTLEAGIRHHLNRELAVFAKLGRSVRFSTVDELFQTSPDFSVQVFSPPEPQTAQHADLGLEFSQGPFSIAPTLYYMRLTNEIAYDPSQYANVNLDPTRRYGAELAAKLQINAQLQLVANYTQRVSQFRDGAYKGNDVPLVPENTANIGVNWVPRPGWELAASATHIGAKRFDNDQNNTFMKIPAYHTVQARITHTYQAWHMSAGVDNLFGTKAYDSGIISLWTPGRYNAYPLPERSFLVSVERGF